MAVWFNRNDGLMNDNNLTSTTGLKWTDGDGIVRMKQSMMVRHWCFEGRWNDSSDPSMIRASPSKATTMRGYEWRCYPSSTTRRWVARECNNKMIGGIRRRQCLLPDEAAGNNKQRWEWMVLPIDPLVFEQEKEAQDKVGMHEHWRRNGCCRIRLVPVLNDCRPQQRNEC